MVETAILARNEAVLESGAESIPSFEIEPPVQGRRNKRGGKGRGSTARRSAALDGQRSCSLDNQLAQG
jgi:hypothetical protein